MCVAKRDRHQRVLSTNKKTTKKSYIKQHRRVNHNTKGSRELNKEPGGTKQEPTNEHKKSERKDTKRKPMSELCGVL